MVCVRVWVVVCGGCFGVVVVWVENIPLCQAKARILRLDFKGPAPSLTQGEHEKFRRQQAPTIVLMFWTSVVSFFPVASFQNSPVFRRG